MQDVPPPHPDEMKEVFAYLWNAVRRAGLPVGVIPEIQVSLVVQPEEASDLVAPSLASRAYEAKLTLLRAAARPYIWWKKRPRSPGRTQAAA
jgi:hypothetical protein